jgi:transcriptional regulator with XRE-family HTH domain
MITGEKVKAARVLLGWTERDLAREPGVRVVTISRMESDEQPIRRSRSFISRALDRAGVEFPEGDH